MPEMAMRMNLETGGFKLLEEDALDDRPCPAVKKFVSSVLDRKDMKDQEVASSFRNLMEYRDSTSSPNACSAAASSTALDANRPNSPPSPSSPSTAPCPMDDQRLPNELFDEICEDIGMKEGMELDFVEYLMEQDTNPHMYMTQEAISSGTFNSTPCSTNTTSTTPAGSVSVTSNNSSDIKTLTVLNPVATTTPNFLFKPNFPDSDWLHPLSRPVSHSTTSSSSESKAKSFEASSSGNKRMHSSASADTGPGKRISQATSGFKHHINTTINGGGAQTSTNNGIVHTGTNGHSLFKMPHPGPAIGKRGHFYPVGSPSPSPVHSSHSSGSQDSNSTCHSSSHPAYSRSQQFSPTASQCQRDSCDQEGGTASNITMDSGKNHRMSPKPLISSCDFIKPGSPSQIQGVGSFSHLPGSVGGQDGGVFQRVDKQQPPPNVSVKSMQQHHQLQQKYQQQSHNQEHGWLGSPQTQINPNDPGVFFNKGMHPGGSYPTHQAHVNHQTGFGNMGHMLGSQGTHQIRTPVDSPLDQGYFSNESAGNCSSGSAPSPAFTSSSMSSFSSASTMMPADHSQKFSQKRSMAQQQQISGTSGYRPPAQKSVHFADMVDGSPPAYAPSPGSVSMEMKPSFDSGNGPVSNCAFEVESDGQPKGLPSGKILPRFNYGMKPGGAPYIVPNNQGQVVGPAASPGYDMNTRPSCAMSVSGDRSSPGEAMQEYASKSSQINGSGGGASGATFYMDSNQNMMRVDSVHDYPPFPPPLISPHSGEYIGMHADHQRFGMNQFSSMQSQASYMQQQSHQMSSTQSMAPLHPHPQSIHHHRQQQPQLHPFSSYSHPIQRIDSELTAQNNMQMRNGNTGSYQTSLAMPTPASDRATRLEGTNGEPGCPPSYDGSFGHGGHQDLYPAQQQPGPPNQVGMGGQQVPFVHRGWAPGVSGPEDLRVQVGDMHPNSMKGSLQPSHSHMQPSPIPGCSAPLGLGSHLQELTMMNSGVHGTSRMGPLQPHMDTHPEYGPCVGLQCNTCKMNHTGNSFQPHPGQCAGPNDHTYKVNSSAGHLSHVGPCAGPGCTACKMNQISRPQMLSSQQKFIQHLIMDEGNAAYRSHPLFPLLRDLVIAEMNFDNPQFHYQQLLSLLPNDFHKLLQNFLHRNPPSGHYQANQAVESVIMDGLRLAHGNLLDKIRHRQQLEQMKTNSSATLRSMEEFCQKFDHAVNGPMGRPVPNGVGSMALGHPMGGYHEGSYVQHDIGHLYLTMKDGPEMYVESSLASTSPQGSKTESKKHPSLPKEAVAMMMEWLRNHKDNPYPNDDEKSMLIKQTGLSINQINYWFTNARRRILPKWSQCKT